MLKTRGAMSAWCRPTWASTAEIQNISFPSGNQILKKQSNSEKRCVQKFQNKNFNSIPGQYCFALVGAHQQEAEAKFSPVQEHAGRRKEGGRTLCQKIKCQNRQKWNVRNHLSEKNFVRRIAGIAEYDMSEM
jgi:hypothetical protein